MRRSYRILVSLAFSLCRNNVCQVVLRFWVRRSSQKSSRSGNTGCYYKMACS
ncbi:hypothetical protein [Phormidesmis priestleyi]